MAASGTEPADRIIWVGGRRTRGGVLGFLRDEPDRDWRGRQTQEMNEACDEMASQGLRLATHRAGGAFPRIPRRLDRGRMAPFLEG
jgi:hypothetical protein